MAYTIVQIQELIDKQSLDARQLLNLITDYLQANPPGNGNGNGGGTLLQATATLTDAQIKALPTTPFQIIAAPGMGKMVNVISCIAHIDTLAAEYTNVEETAYMLLGTGNLVEDLSTYTLPGFFQYAAKTTAVIGGVSYLKSGSTIIISEFGYTSNFENSSCVLILQNSVDLTGGDSANTLKITVNYLIVDL